MSRSLRKRNHLRLTGPVKRDVVVRRAHRAPTREPMALGQTLHATRPLPLSTWTVRRLRRRR